MKIPKKITSLSFLWGISGLLMLWFDFLYNIVWCGDVLIVPVGLYTVIAAGYTAKSSVNAWKGNYNGQVSD